MKRLADRFVPRRLQRLLVVLGALGLLLTPVDYRAGAEHAHPHAVLQVWADVGHGRAVHPHGEDVHQHGSAYLQRCLDQSSPSPRFSIVSPGMFISPRATTLSLSCNEAPDIPQPAEAAHKATIPLTMIEPAELLPARSSTAAWQELAVLKGRSPSPDTPPPRPI